VQRENKTAGTERGNIVIELILKSGKPNSLVWQERNSIHRQFVSTHIARIRFPATLSRAAKHTCCAVARHLRGVAFLHRRHNSICAAVRAERAAHRRYRHVKRKHMQIRYFPTIWRAPAKDSPSCAKSNRGVAATQPAPHIHQEQVYQPATSTYPTYLPLTRSLLHLSAWRYRRVLWPNVSGYWLYIFIGECAATGSCDVRSVRFQHRSLPSAFCSTSTLSVGLSLSMSMYVSLSLSLYLSL